MSHPEADVARAIRIVRIITLALAAGLVVFAAVAAFMIRDGGILPESDLSQDVLPWAAAAGALVLVVAPWLGHRVADSGRQTRTARVQSFLSGRILVVSLQDAVGLTGLVLGLLTGSLPWALAFAGASVAALLLSLPREEELRERLRRAPGNTGGADMG